MGYIQEVLTPIEEYLISIIRNTDYGWYELEVGISSKWVYNDNNNIMCTVIASNDSYVILKLIPKNENVDLDEMINFFKIIIETNEKIARKEEDFKIKMEKIRFDLEEEAKRFYDELEILKENSFKSSDKINSNPNPKDEPVSSKRIKSTKVSDRKAPLIILNSDEEESDTSNNQV